MRTVRPLIACAVALSLVGCASMKATNARTDAAFAGSQIVVQVDDPPDREMPRVMQSFMTNQLSVSGSQNSLVEAKLARETGVLGQYEITARALVLPREQGSQITLYAEELTYQGSTATVLNTMRVNSKSRGRAGDTWRKLNAIAAMLQPDSSRRRLEAQP